MTQNEQPKLTGIARTLRKHDTWAEKLMWSWLRSRRFTSYKFRRQHQYGPYVLDFFCIEAALDVELDGEGHGRPKQSQIDRERDQYLEARGIKVLRFWNSRLRTDKDSIRDTIFHALQERAPHRLPDYCYDLSIANSNSRTESAPTHAKVKGTGGLASPLPKGEGQGEGEGNVRKARRVVPHLKGAPIQLFSKVAL